MCMCALRFFRTLALVRTRMGIRPCSIVMNEIGSPTCRIQFQCCRGRTLPGSVMHRFVARHFFMTAGTTARRTLSDLTLTRSDGN